MSDTHTVGITQARRDIFRLWRLVQRGDEVIITKQDTGERARLVPFRETPQQPQPQPQPKPQPKPSQDTR